MIMKSLNYCLGVGALLGVETWSFKWVKALHLIGRASYLWSSSEHSLPERHSISWKGLINNDSVAAVVRRLPCFWSKRSLVNARLSCAWVFKERGKPGYWSKIKPPGAKTRTPVMRQPKNWTKKKQTTVEPLTHVFFVLHFDAAYLFYIFHVLLSPVYF